MILNGAANIENNERRDHATNGLDMNDKVDGDKIKIGHDSDRIEGEKSSTIPLNLEREVKDLELTKKQISQFEIDNEIIKSVPEETSSSQGQDSNKTGTKLTTTLDPQTSGVQIKEENSVELRKESDASNEQKNDAKVASLMRSVPPLSESALNLPVLPPAFIKMVLYPDQSVVSTNSKDSFLSFAHILDQRNFAEYLPPANEVCEGYVFTGVCLSTGGDICPGGWSLSRGVPVQVGLCSGGSLSRGGLCPLSWGISVQGVPVQEGLWGGSLSRGVSEGEPPYSYVWAVRILLECILVVDVYTPFVEVRSLISNR